MTIVAAASVIVIALSLLAPGSASVRTITVAPGDSMVSIALREFPGMDPQRVSELIHGVNQLDGGVLRAGDQLNIPTFP